MLVARNFFNRRGRKVHREKIKIKNLAILAVNILSYSCFGICLGYYRTLKVKHDVAVLFLVHQHGGT